MPSSEIIVPEYVNVLKNLPKGGVIDTVAPSTISLYFQTIHEKPMGDGYISRYPMSVYTEYQKKTQAIQTGDYSSLMDEYNIRYLVTASEMPAIPLNILKTLYNNNGIKIFEIMKSNSGVR